MVFDNRGQIGNLYVSATTDEARELLTQSLQGQGLQDYLKTARDPVRLTDLATQSDFAALPADQHPIKTFLGVPIYHQDEHVGDLCLAEKEEGQPFTDQDDQMAAMFAAQAASIIFNARRYEAELRTRADLENLLDDTPVGVVVFDAQTGQLAYINQEIRRMMSVLEFPEESMANAFEVMSFFRPDGRELSFEELPLSIVLQSGEKVEPQELLLRLPNGNEMNTVVNVSPVFSEAGEILSVVTVMQDLTPLGGLERKRAEFLEMVSEELRTPLIGIKGSAAALKDVVEPINSAESVQLLRIIDQHADLMRSQVNSLIELAQIETGTLTVVTQSVDVTELLNGSCQDFLRDHSVNNIQNHIPSDLPNVMVDKQRIGQVVHNFLRQAARHADDSSRINVTAAAEDIHVAVTIAVEGSVSSRTEPAHRYWNPDTPESFKNLSHSHARLVDQASHGEGLATAFCRGVIEAHGGRIRTDFDEREGSPTLTFTLPSVEDKPVPELHTPNSLGISGKPPSASAEKIQILVSIEDPTLLRRVRQVLLDSGYGVVATSSLDEVEALASSERPKLIVLDIAGREEQSFRTLRGAGNSLHLPAIVLCERDDEDYVVRAFEMGADGYMVKPFSPSELIARIKATLRRLSDGGEPAATPTFQSGDVRINFDERTVNVSGQQVQMTATEYKLLTELAHAAGRILTQDMLLQRVWGPEYSGESQLLRSYIKSLRQKLGDNARKPTYIFTEHGIGYRMAKSETTYDRPAPVS